jgi:uncharacterized Zn-finger protein
MTIVNAKASGDAVVVGAADLHGDRAVFCPNPKMALWSNHPRVFIDVGTTGQGQCPYCGTRYQLAEGAARSGH